MMEDKLEGTGLPAHGLVFLDVSLVLDLPLYLYVEPWGKKLEQNHPQSRFARKARVPPGLQDQMPQSLASGPGPDARVSDVWPPGLRKAPFAPSYSPMGLTPWPNHIIQYMNLYLWTIPELLVMSVISSGTPNNIRWQKNSNSGLGLRLIG